jgi:hypothetical protein
VQQQVRELSELSNQVGELTEAVHATLRDQAAAVADAAAAADRDMSGVRRQLFDQVVVLNAAADQVNDRLTEIGGAVAAKAQSLVAAANQALDRAKEIGAAVERQADAVTGAIDWAAGRAQDFGARFQQQTVALTEAAALAIERAEQLKKTEDGVVRDRFLRAATTIVDELNTLAGDIHAVLDLDVPKEILQRFRNGERSVFARRLFRHKDEYLVPGLEQRFGQDQKFRDLVTRYIKRFEELLAQADAADPESLLNSTFITADIGKLYLVLSRNLGRAARH